MKFVVFKRHEDGVEISVNVDAIEYAEPFDGRSRLFMRSGDYIVVDDEFDNTMYKLEEAYSKGY